MKRMLCVVTILVLLFCGCAQEKPENPYRLKEQSYVSYNRFEDTYSEPWVWENFYNEEGWFCGNRDNQGNATESVVDAYGNIIRTVFYKDGEVTDEVDYNLTLDDQHRILRSESYAGERMTGIQEFTYDRKGNITRNYISRISEDGTAIDSEVTMEYDWRGNLIREETRWNHSGGSDKILEYDNGHVSHTETYNEAGELEEYSDYIWEEETHTETCRSHYADGTLYRIGIITYDEYNNPLEQNIYYSDDYYRPEHPQTGLVEDIADRIDTWSYERIPE